MEQQQQQPGQPDNYSLAFIRICELAEAKGEAPIGNRVWATEFGHWRVAVNGSRETIDRIPPFEALITYRGLPAGLINPVGGTIVAGQGVNEDAFIEAIEAEIARLGGTIAE